RRDHAERVLGQCPVEAWEAALVELVGAVRAVGRLHAGLTAGDRRVDVLRTEEPEGIVVGARDGGGVVRSRGRVALAWRLPLRAVNRVADEVGLRQRARRGARRCELGVAALVPLR